MMHHTALVIHSNLHDGNRPASHFLLSTCPEVALNSLLIQCKTNLLTDDQIECSYFFYFLTQRLRGFNWVENLLLNNPFWLAGPATQTMCSNWTNACPYMCVHVCFLAPSILSGRCGEVLLILTACFIFRGIIVPVYNINGLQVLAWSMSFGNIGQLWKMTLWSNWLLWNECYVIHAWSCVKTCDRINPAWWIFRLDLCAHNVFIISKFGHKWKIRRTLMLCTTFQGGGFKMQALFICRRDAFLTLSHFFFFTLI